MSLAGKALPALVRAISHARRYPDRGSRLGRPPRFSDEELVFADRILASVLDRETSGRVSIRYFSDHYLSILGFPSEIEAALRAGEINLAEAEQVARVSARNLKADEAAARRVRARILSSHSSAHSREQSLRDRVNDALGVIPEGSNGGSGPASVPSDHFFYDVLRTIERTIRALGEGEISTPAQERIYEHGDQILLILHREKVARSRQVAPPVRMII